MKHGEQYRSINRAIAGEVYTYEIGVTQTASGRSDAHADYLFAYRTPGEALDYATRRAPDGAVALLECDVVGLERGGKLYCTEITPRREIPIRRGDAYRGAYSEIAGGRAPIRYVAGCAHPTLTGESYYWTTPGGRPIRYPNAYRWPKVYHGSTRKITVGADWAPLVIDTDYIYSDDTH